MMQSSGSSPDGSFALELWSSLASQPGVLLETLSGNSNPRNEGLYTYTDPGAYSLAANTSYWIVGHCENTFDGFYWSDGNSFAPATGSTLGLCYSRDGRISWRGPSSVRTLRMQVNADVAAVPEPSQWAMMGVTALVAGGYGLRQWRRGQAK